MKGKLLYWAVILALLLGTGVPLVLAQDEITTHYACVNNRSGAVKIVSAEVACHKNEHKISWNNIGPEGAQGPPGPVGPSTATLAFNPIPPFTEVTLTNVTLNGGLITAPLVPGATVQVEVDYSITQPDWCPACIQQIVFGFASQDQPSVCVHSGGAGSGHASFTLTVPDTPGTEYIAVERPMMDTCDDALAWNWPTPQPNQYIGVVAIH